MYALIFKCMRSGRNYQIVGNVKNLTMGIFGAWRMNSFKGNGRPQSNEFIHLSIFIHLHKFFLHLTSYVGEASETLSQIWT